MRGRAAGTPPDHILDLLASGLLLQARFEADVSQTMSNVYSSANLYMESEPLERLSVPTSIRSSISFSGGLHIFGGFVLVRRLQDLLMSRL